MFYKKIIYSILVVCIAFTLVSCSYATDDGSFDNSSNVGDNLSFSDDYVVSDGSSSDFNSLDGSYSVGDYEPSSDEDSVSDEVSVTKFVSKDVMVHELSNDSFSVGLVDFNNSAVIGANVNVKVLDYDFNLLEDYDLVTDDDGKVSIPCSFLKGIYFVAYDFKGNGSYSSAYGMNRLEVIHNTTVVSTYSSGMWVNKSIDLKVPTFVLVEDTNIYQRGSIFKGRVVDYYNNPLSGKKVDLVDVYGLDDYNIMATVYTDADGYFYLPINKSVGVYDICCRFAGDSNYEYSQSLISLNVSYVPNFRYLVNLTDNGREIGIYKNGKLYKYSYDCSVSGATKLNNSVLYFVSLEGSSYSLQRLDSVSQINSAGVSLYCDGENVLITYYGYAGEGLGYFNVIFDGKTSGSNHICNLSLYSKDSLVACLYFSSEKNVNSYAPVYTNFTVFNKNYNVNSIFYNNCVSDGNWEYLYYGDVSYDNPLKRAGWSSSLGYESVQSYLFCEDEITNDIMSAYLVNASNFSGVRKVVYDNFLTALAYQWLADKLANELADEYHVGWAKIGYPLVSSFTGVNGRFISVIDTTCAVSGLDFNRFNRMYGLYGSLLEEYVMSLTGSEATCAVSEVFKGLLNGGEFYYYYDSENLCTVLKLADNSSWLEFSDWGYINSLINRVDLQNKYNGGMCLGNFNYSDGSEIVSNLKRLSNSFSIAPTLVGLISSLADSSMYVTGGAVGSVLMPYVLFALCVAQISLLLDPDCCVGEPDGYVDNFYVTHPNWVVKVPNNEIIQFNRKPNLDDFYEIQKNKTFEFDSYDNLDGTDGDPDNKTIFLVFGVSGLLIIAEIFDPYVNHNSNENNNSSNVQTFNISNLYVKYNRDDRITMVFV